MSKLIVIKFGAQGTPRPKGSTKSFRSNSTGKIITLNANDKTKGWEQTVRAAAINAMEPYKIAEGAVSVRCDFIMPRPKNHFSVSKKTPGMLKEQYRAMEPTKKPDLDKLIRCVLDALTGVVYLDDNQVTVVSGQKYYAQKSNDNTGVLIKVEYKEA